MLSNLLHRVSLFRTLHQIDQDLASACRKAGCPYCGGPLHKSAYIRKPRGGPPNLPEKYQIRFSFCCGRGDCRRRVLPPSCRFMGRKVYWNAVILIALTLRHRRPNGISANRLARMFAISRKTIIRWIHYFRDEFAASVQWQRLRGQVNASVEDQSLPGSLVSHFLDHFPSQFEGLIGCIRFLASGQTR